MTEDIFNPSDDKTKDIDTNQLLNLFADKLMKIKKDDGTPKYDTIDKALDALAASQEHIARLEQEAKTSKQLIDEATVNANKAKELEELVRRMADGNNDDPGKLNTGNPPVGGLSEKDAAELVKRILNEEKQMTSAIGNVSAVQTKLVARFGDKAADMIDAKAKELGVSKQQLKELSATSPAMVLALFGENPTQIKPNTSSYSFGSPSPTIEEIQRPEKSILSGRNATTKNQMELMKRIKANVYQKYEVTTP